MKILSKIGRVPGEVVELDGQKYGFQTDAAGRFFTEVSNPEHIGTLLAIREGFVLHPDETGVAPVAVVAQPQAPVQEIPPPVDEIVGDDDEDDDENAAAGNGLDAMPIEKLRAEYMRLTGKVASDKAPAHILRKTLAKLLAAA